MKMKILFVGDVPDAARAWGTVVALRALSAAEATEQVEKARPDVLVVASTGWASTWAAQLAPERRPPVILVGPLPDSTAAPDEWIGSLDVTAELPARLRLAIQRGRERRRAARRAMVDPLTGLPNRRAGIRALVHAAARARRGEFPVSLVLLDLDHFKTINDTLGHDAGDRALRKVGATLLRVVRQDEVCARIGGDEFAIVIHGPVRSARAAAHRVSTALREVGVETSAAVAQLHHGERLRDFYRRTDSGLQAKKANRPDSKRPRPSGIFVAA